jgi:hypothetical protein
VLKPKHHGHLVDDDGRVKLYDSAQVASVIRIEEKARRLKERKATEKIE